MGLWLAVLPRDYNTSDASCGSLAACPPRIPDGLTGQWPADSSSLKAMCAGRSYVSGECAAVALFQREAVRLGTLDDLGINLSLTRITKASDTECAPAQ